MSANDELVSQFMAFTGSNDAASAASYLEMSGGNLETAVSLFMEHGEQGSGAGGGGAAGMMGGEEQVRAPDETRRMRLMDDQMLPAVDPALQVMNQMMEEQLMNTAFASSSNERRRDARAAVNAAAQDDDHDDDDSNEYKYEDDDDEDVQMVSAPRLEDMFAAPKHLMHTAGGFQGARAIAKDSRRWLLVNIQRDSEFSSHALNRDVWNNDLIENLIREGFIFWQQVS